MADANIGAWRLPAEWEAQSGVMLTWPHPDTDWADQLAVVEQLYTRLAALITAHEPLLLVCRDEAHRLQMSERMQGALPTAAFNRLRLAIAPSNDTWARDYGPITLIDDQGGAQLVDFRFNGWGGKFRADLDDGITQALHRAGLFGDTPLVQSPLVLEGGAIDSDGAGSLLLVERTLIDPARNPGWDRAAIERELEERLGTQRFLWLAVGQLQGDDTDGHIDTLARFCDPETICHAAPCEDASAAEDPDTPVLQGLRQALESLRRADGKPYRLIPLPQPRPIVDASGEQLPAGYANFLIIDGAVLVPTYDDPADAVALARLGEAFPGREILGLDCRPLIRQGGSLHCISMQLPAALDIRQCA